MPVVALVLDAEGHASTGFLNRNGNMPLRLCIFSVSFCVLFTTLSVYNYVASNDGMVGELERMWKEALMA
jgi:hypothetical protein